MIAYNRRKRLEEKKARVAAVKALKLKPGDWIVTCGGLLAKASPFMLDARSSLFQGLRRATPEEIAAQEAALAERQREQEERIAYANRPDVCNASHILSCGVNDLLMLGPEFLDLIVKRLQKRGDHEGHNSEEQ